MKLAATRSELATLLAGAGFVRGYGFRLVSVSAEGCTIEMPFRKALERPGRVVNGPALMAAADVAMWLAIKSRIGIAHDALTSELNTAFLAPARNQAVRCTAQILKLGRRSIYGVARCHNRAGMLFTHHTLTYVRVPAE